MTDGGYFTDDFIQHGWCVSPIVLQILCPWSPNERVNLLLSEKRTWLNGSATVLHSEPHNYNPLCVIVFLLWMQRLQHLSITELLNLFSLTILLRRRLSLYLMVTHLFLPHRPLPAVYLLGCFDTASSQQPTLSVMTFCVLPSSWNVLMMVFCILVWSEFFSMVAVTIDYADI